MPALVKLGAAADIPHGEGKAFTCGDRRVAVFNIDGNFFAIDDACPHAGGPLSDGWIEGTEVICPWHGWAFDVRPCAEDPKDGVCRYKVHVEAGTIAVELPD